MRTFQLQHLNCANCANKIEQRVNQLPYVTEAKVDFISKRLVVEGESEGILDDIQHIATAVENGVKVLEKNEGHVHNHDHSHGADGASSFKGEFLSILITIGVAFCVMVYFDGKAQTILGGILLLIAGKDIFLNALRGIRSGEIFDENLLMTIAAIAAFYIGEHAEALGVLLLYRFGEALQDYALERATKSVEDLLSRDVDTAQVLKDGKLIEVEAEDLVVGDILVLRAGDTLAADAKIIEGEGHVSNKHMTGESTPIAAGVDDGLMAGAIALDGAFKAVVTKVAKESTMAKIEGLVADARLNKGRTENWISRFAAIYTPIVVVVALVVAVVAPLFFGGDWNDWIYKACAFLIISCPCALVLSVPLTMFASIGRASKDGMFIKGSTAVEALSEADAIAFDKTGTLTDGKFAVSHVDVLQGTEAEILSIAATAEQFSNHPIAKSLLDVKGPSGEVENYKEVSGKGIKCTIDGKAVAVGNDALLESLGLQSTLPSIAETSVYVVLESTLIGRISFTDSIKVGVKDALKALGTFLHTYIFSGDKKELVEAVGKELGIDETYGGLLPDEKVGALDDALQKNKKVVYVGDGINDAPVLAKSDVGIAMGDGGADMAIQSADVVILGDDIAKLPLLFSLSKRTKGISHFNIALALGIKLIVVLLSMVGIANLWLAVFADVGVSLICVLISMSLLKYKTSN